MMRKRLLIVLELFCGSLYANEAVQYVTVEQKNGEKFSFLITDNPILSFKDGDLIVNGNTETSYAIAGVRNFHFSDYDQTGVVNQGSDVLLLVRVDNNAICVEHVKAGSPVILYNSAGVPVVNAVADRTGTANLAYPGQKGVYVLSVDGKSFKLIRK